MVLEPFEEKPMWHDLALCAISCVDIVAYLCEMCGLLDKCGLLGLPRWLDIFY